MTVEKCYLIFYVNITTKRYRVESDGRDKLQLQPLLEAF